MSGLVQQPDKIVVRSAHTIYPYSLGEPPVQALTPVVISSLIYQTVWVAFITYVTWFWLIRTYPVSRLAPFTFLTPLFGVMAGSWLLGETVTIYLLCALAMVGAGIYLVNRR
jgi:drug/metabolite transporter (DMT)-like permease